MLNSENGSLYVAIGGIVLVYGIHGVTLNRSKLNAEKDSISPAPSDKAEHPKPT